MGLDRSKSEFTPAEARAVERYVKHAPKGHADMDR